jgi:hypothetical protein
MTTATIRIAAEINALATTARAAARFYGDNPDKIVKATIPELFDTVGRLARSCEQLAQQVAERDSASLQPASPAASEAAIDVPDFIVADLPPP